MRATAGVLEPDASSPRRSRGSALLLPGGEPGPGGASAQRGGFPPAPALARSALPPSAAATAAALALLVAAALAAPWLAPVDPLAQDFSASLRPPAWVAGGGLDHPLGTDRLGRDVAANVVYGLRVSLLVGAAAVAISLVLGVAAGLAAGYAGGRLDGLLMRAADVQLALPPILVALAVVALFGPGLWRLIVLIGLINWAVYARTVRGSVLAVREREFVEAARALGAPLRAILLRHVLPNVLAATVVVAAVELPRVMLLEATLSFLGLGVPPTVPSLGAAVARGYQVLLSGHWWVSVFPGLALMAAVVCVNLLGDWLRDVTDPRWQPWR